jgi:hypothetical protein
MQLTAKLLQILPIQSGTGKNGLWQKHSLVVETLDQYHNNICLTIWGDQLDLSKIKIGDKLAFEYFIQSKEYNGKWYTNIIATELETEDIITTECEIPDELAKEIYDYFREVNDSAETVGEEIKSFGIVIDKFKEEFKKETSKELDGTVLTEILDYFEKNDKKQSAEETYAYLDKLLAHLPTTTPKKEPITVSISIDSSDNQVAKIDMTASGNENKQAIAAIVLEEGFQEVLDMWYSYNDLVPMPPSVMVEGISKTLVNKYQSLSKYKIVDVELFAVEKLKNEKIEDIRLLEYIESFNKVGIDDQKDKDAIAPQSTTPDSETEGNVFLISSDPNKLATESIEKLRGKLRPLSPGKIQEGDFL